MDTICNTKEEKKLLTFRSGDPNFSRPRIVKLGGERMVLLGLTNLNENGDKNTESGGIAQQMDDVH